MNLKRFRNSCSNNIWESPKGMRKERGSVLFIVLIFIIAITTLVWITSLKLSSEVDFIESEMSRLRAYTLCISGMEFLKNRLYTGGRNNIEFLDGMTEKHFPRLLLDGSDIPFYFPDIIEEKYRRGLRIPNIEQMGFILNLQDSAGLINIFKIDRTLFKNLLEFHGFSSSAGDVILDSIFDWIDKDSFARPHGAEADYYISRYGFPAANRLLDSRDELLLIRGMDRSIYDKIGGLLDFTVENQGLNPNTMPAEVFYLFKGISDNQIERVLKKRLEPNGIEGVGSMTLVSGFNFAGFPDAFRFFTSNTTYVKIKAQMDEDRFYYITFCLKGVSGGGSMRQATDGTRPGPIQKEESSPFEDFNHYFHIKDWQEGTEFQIPQYLNYKE